MTRIPTMLEEFEYQAEWREQKAVEWPEDAERSLQAADGIRDLVDWLCSDEGKPYLARLVPLWLKPDHGHEVTERVARFRFNDASEPFEGFVENLIGELEAHSAA